MRSRSIAPGGRLGEIDGGTRDSRRQVIDPVFRTSVPHRLTYRKPRVVAVHPPHTRYPIDIIGGGISHEPPLRGGPPVVRGPGPISEPPRAHPPIVVGGGISHEPPPRGRAIPSGAIGF